MMSRGGSTGTGTQRNEDNIEQLFQEKKWKEEVTEYKSARAEQQSKDALRLKNSQVLMNDFRDASSTANAVIPPSSFTYSQENSNSPNLRNNLTNISTFEEKNRDLNIRNEGEETEKERVFKSVLGVEAIRFPKDMKFDEFLRERSQAFFYFSNHSLTSNTFERSDIEIAEGIRAQKRNQILTTYFTAALTMFYFTKFLRLRNLPWGLTYKSSLLNSVLKYYMFPQTVTNLLDKFYFTPPFQQSMDTILEKYNFLENPLFLSVFEASRKE